MRRMMGIQFPIRVEQLTWPPGPTYRRFPSCRPIRLPIPLRQPVLFARFQGCGSLIVVAHGWACSHYLEEAPLVFKKTQLTAQPERNKDRKSHHKRPMERFSCACKANFV